MARLGSPGCHVDVCLRRGGEEAGLVVSTGLPQPTAFERLRRRENEILKSVSQPPNDCCSATRVNSKAARSERDTPPPSPLLINMCALSAQAIDAAEGPGCSTARRKLPDLAAGGGAGRRVSRDRLLLRGAALHGPRAELAAAAWPLAGALASRHPHGRCSSDGRALLVVLVFESPSSVIIKRLKLFFAHLELHSSRNPYQTAVCGLCRKPVDTPKNRRAAVR